MSNNLAYKDTMNIIVATNNSHKTKEISDILNMPKWNFYSLSDIGISSNPEENADSFLGNARLKAYCAAKAINQAISEDADKYSYLKQFAILADDSGLCVDALDGAPGLYSARYSGYSDGVAAAPQNNAKLLHELHDIKNPDKRTAHFNCTVVILLPKRDSSHSEMIEDKYMEISSSKNCYGKIAFEPNGNNGFGYDPLFLCDAFDNKLTNAQLTPKQKDEVSHRAMALQHLKEKLESLCCS